MCWEPLAMTGNGQRCQRFPTCYVSSCLTLQHQHYYVGLLTDKVGTSPIIRDIGTKVNVLYDTSLLLSVSRASHVKGASVPETRGLAKVNAQLLVSVIL
jgi:hypothetical protein